MNDELGQALNDLADAAARTASRGIVAEPSVGLMLARLTTAVRRRRAAKTAGAGLLALVLVAVMAGAVGTGLRQWQRGPAVMPPVTAPPTPSPSTSTVSGSSSGKPGSMAREAVSERAAAAPSIGDFRFIKTIDAGGSILQMFATSQYDKARADPKLDAGPVIIVSPTSPADTQMIEAQADVTPDARLASLFGTQVYSAPIPGDLTSMSVAVQAADGYIEFVGNRMADPDQLDTFVEGYFNTPAQ